MDIWVFLYLKNAHMLIKIIYNLQLVHKAMVHHLKGPKQTPNGSAYLLGSSSSPVNTSGFNPIVGIVICAANYNIICHAALFVVIIRL